jgi:hypothetical protein
MRKDRKLGARDERACAIFRGDRTFINLAGPIIMWLASALLIVCGLLLLTSILNNGVDGIVQFGGLMIPLFGLWCLSRLIPKLIGYVNKHYP